MFEIGKKYDLTILEWGGDGPGPVQMYGRVAAEIEGSVVKFVSPAQTLNLGPGGTAHSPETEIIVNTNSLYFVSAQPTD